MSLRSQIVILLLGLLLGLPKAAAAQVLPQATGPSNPLRMIHLDYSLRYAQTAEWGAGLGDWQTSTLSGNLNYSNHKPHFPFDLNYGGGYTWTIAGPAYMTGFFHHLTLSQGMNWRRWNISLGDNVSYSPEAPTFGFTGIPGIGEPISGSTPALPPTDQSILRMNTHVVDNTINGDVTRSVTPVLKVNFATSYNLFRFPDGDGINNNTTTASGGVTWRLNRRNSLTSSYVYSQFSYPDLNFSFRSDTGFMGYQRNWSRKVTSTVSFGPQWISSSASSVVPAGLGFAANAMLTYQSAYSTAGVSYYRGVNAGAGYLVGGMTDTTSADFSRQLGGRLTLEFSASYYRTSGLPGGAGITTAKYGGMEATRRLGRYMVLFANYSAVDQSSSASLPGNVLGQLYQVAGFGLGYSPREGRRSR